MSSRACSNWSATPNAGFRAKQSGAALIMALLIVAVVAGLAIRFAADYQLGMARAESRWHGVQARAYIEGAESLAAMLLSEDDPEVDGLHEPWAQPLPPFEVEGGWIMAEIQDARGRFNLNNLLSVFDPEKAPNDPTRYTADQRRFLRLLQSFEDQPIPEEMAIAMLEAVVDWMDPNDEVSGFGGAESNYYQSLDPRYLPANGLFTSVDELRLVRYFTPEVMALIRPYLVVLPAGQGMNVNTMSRRLLQTLNASDQLMPLTEMQVQLLLEGWPLEGYYMQLQDFTGNPAWGSMLASSNPPDTDGLTINTSYFLVQLQVQLVDQRRSVQTLMQRDGDSFKVVRRSDVY